MKTAQKICIAILSVALVISAAALGISYFAQGDSDGNIRIIPQGEYKGDAIENVQKQSLVTDYPLVRTDIENIFYCLSPDGSVSYYEFNAETFSAYEGEVKKIELNPTCTYYKIPITVYYIEAEGKTIGYGLFTTENSDENVNLYSYVFAKLTDAPTVYGAGDKILLLNMNPDEAYCTEKTYTDIFEVDMEKKKCSTITAQRDRTADKTGCMTERWSVFTDGYLASVSKKAGMISGRLYDEGTKFFDVYDLNKSIMEPQIKEIYGTFLRENADSGLVYIKKTADGFKSVEYIAEEKTIVDFKGDIDKDFVFDGDWIFDKKEKIFTNLVTGKTVAVEKIDEGVTGFCANSQGTNFAVKMENSVSSALCFVTSDGSITQYVIEDSFHPEIRNMCFVDEAMVLVTVVTKDGKCENYIISAK